MSNNVFASVKKAKNTVEEDFVGGGGVLETDLYEAKIKTAYLGTSSSSKAQSMNLLLDVNGQEVRETVWMSNRNGGVTYTKDKVEYNLPGFNQINSLCLLVAGKELGDMEVEELTVKLYDHDVKKEVPQAVD